MNKACALLVLATVMTACGEDGRTGEQPDPPDAQVDSGNTDTDAAASDPDAATPVADAGSAQDAAPSGDAGIDQGGFVRLFPDERFKAGVLAADATHLYWTEADGVSRMAFAAHVREVIVSDQVAPSHLSVAGNELYWIDFGRRGTSQNVPSSMGRSTLDGSDQTVLASGLLKGSLFRTFVDIQTDGSSIYLLETGTPQSLYDDGAIQKMAMTGGQLTPVVSGIRSARRLLHDAERFYLGWSNVNNDGAIEAIPLDGSSRTQLAPAGRALGDMMLLGDDVWWINTANPALIKRVPKAGGSAATFVEGAATESFSCLANDGAHVYWAAKRGQQSALYKRALEGGESVRLAWGPRACKALLVAGGKLYWTSDDGQLLASDK